MKEEEPSRVKLEPSHLMLLFDRVIGFKYSFIKPGKQENTFKKTSINIYT